MKKYIIISILLSLLLSSCWSNSNNSKDIIDIEKTNIENISEDKNEKDLNNNISSNNTNNNVLNVEKKENNLLWSVLDDVSNEERLELEKSLEEKNNLEQIIWKYLLDINEDKDIINHISTESIEKIKTETTDTYNAFSDEEKKLFLEDIKILWYSKNSFIITNNEHIEEYINVIIKSGIKREWAIKWFDIVKYEKIDDLNKYYIDYNIEYHNGKKKNIKLFISEWKIQITL